MSTAATLNKDSVGETVLLLAFELGHKDWKLGFATGFEDEPRVRTIRAGNLGALIGQIAAAKKHFKVPLSSPVVSCYEAGREGFWLHRFLDSKGIVNLVVDSSSIEVNRRKRRAKTDRLDTGGLLRLLIRQRLGDAKAFSVVRVPSIEDEDARSLHRELQTLKKERTRSTNRIKGLLVGQGLRLDQIRQDFLGWMQAARLWDGSPLPKGVRSRIEREYGRRQVIHQQILSLRAQRCQAIRNDEGAAIDQIRKLSGLRSIGEGSAWLLVMEFFGWRKFANGRQVGALSGFAPTPYQSGQDHREQGISKAGNRHVRGRAVELAWAWLRYQPDSELTRWYLRRFARGGPRARKIGIVALARKILIALWRYLEFDELPKGATLKG
jgi:transposase|tara:strand:- start:338 stop:1480 length:1143 start_codon:yes stop_codon:yes gene_type:complete